MNKHYSDAAKHHHGGGRASDMASHHAKSKVVHMHSAPPAETGEINDTPAFLAWPSHLLEIMITPWRGPMDAWRESWSGFTPLEAWVESRRSNKTFPKTESRETGEAYFYLVEMPGITREQISLSFQHGTIMLRIDESEAEQTKNSHYHHSRSLRRAFSLPVYTDGEAITAQMKGGVLTITIPKTDKPVSPHARTIDID